MSTGVARAAAPGPWEGRLGAGPRGAKQPGAGPGDPPGRGRARAERDALAATCCWIFPSSVTTQCVVAKAPRAATLSKAERLRSQPGPEQGGSSHRPRTPTAAAILPPRPGCSHRKRKLAPAARHLGEVGAGGGGARAALPADERLSQPPFGRSGQSGLASGRRQLFCYCFPVRDAISWRGNQREIKVVF